jgi:hypothetical protein
MVCWSTPSRVGVFPPANEVVAQTPVLEVEGLLLAARKMIPRMMARPMTTAALTARTIHPVRAFFREPTGSVLLDVSAMMPKTRLGMPMKQVVRVASPDTTVKMIADVLLGPGAPVAYGDCPYAGYCWPYAGYCCPGCGWP